MSASDAPLCFNSSDHPPESAADDNRKLHGSSKKIRLSDGRFIAYIEKGVPRDEANYKVLVVHGFDSSKDMNFVAPQVGILCSVFICSIFGALNSFDL